MFNQRKNIIWQPVTVLSILLVGVLSASADSIERSAALESTTLPGLYIVQLADPPASVYRGELPGLPAIPVRKDAPRRMDASSPQARDYVAFLDRRQQDFVADITAASDRQPVVLRNFHHAINALVITLDDTARQAAAQHPDVRLIEPVAALPLTTDAGPAFIGAPAIWDGSATAGQPATRGEGVVVGIIDSGINWPHPSFSATDGDGFAHTNPLGAGNYLGLCDSEPPDPLLGPACNDKLIGAWDPAFDFVQLVNTECALPDPSSGTLGLTAQDCNNLAVPLTNFENALDENGHGTHVAGTAVGNAIDGNFQGVSVSISGVAPRANLVVYDACHTNSVGQGSCFNFATLASIEQVVIDGIVDVINYSIGGGTGPWTQAISLAFANAAANGVFVAAAGGNSGPGPSTVSHFQPWVTTVANSSHTRGGVGNNFSATGPGTPPAVLVEQGVITGPVSAPFNQPIPGSTPLVASPDINTQFPDPENEGDGCTPFAANTFAGAIAVLRRGGCAFATKAANAVDAGAVAVVIANNVPEGVIAPGGSPQAPVPVFGASSTLGNEVADFFAANPAATAEITLDPQFVEAQSGVTSISSSRGPAPATFDLLKPDIIAPGSLILAADVGSSTQLGLKSGTSMASPHVAGAAALVRAVHPDWSPMEIKSAILTTAISAGLLSNQSGGAIVPAIPFDVGAGRVNLEMAAEAGLVLDESILNMLDNDPQEGGNLPGLNLAAMQQRGCGSSCSWTRTVRNARDQVTSWTASGSADNFQIDVVPGSFELLPGDVIFRDDLDGPNAPNSSFQRLEVTASNVSSGSDFDFGELILSEIGLIAPDARLPVVVQQQ